MQRGERRSTLRWAALVALTAVAGCATEDTAAAPGAQEGAMAMRVEHDGQELYGHYVRPGAFPKPLPDDRHSHDGWTWGSVGAVFAETPDRIWIVQRGELPLMEGEAPWSNYSFLGRGNAPPTTDGISATCQQTGNLRGYERRWEHSILVVDSEGNLVDEWPQWEYLWGQQPCGRGVHKVKISPYDEEKHVWMIDDQLHMIYRFTYDGSAIDHQLGELGVRGRSANNFDRPTDIAWLPDGTYFISDGYGGKRVAKYDPNDNFIMDWGQEPVNPDNPGPNEFNTVHSIAISQDRMIYVADRAHARIQVFDENGNFQFMFPTGQRGESLPYAHEIFTEPDGQEYIWVTDGGTDRILKYDLDGNYLYGFSTPGGDYGHLIGAHSITTDQNGNMYTAEVFAGRVQKWVPLPNADPSKIAGQQLRMWE
jgi:hypothetical protein